MKQDRSGKRQFGRIKSPGKGHLRREQLWTTTTLKRKNRKKGNPGTIWKRTILKREIWKEDNFWKRTNQKRTHLKRTHLKQFWTSTTLNRQQIRKKDTSETEIWKMTVLNNKCGKGIFWIWVSIYIYIYIYIVSS